MAGRVRSVVALDRAGDDLRHAPAAHQHGADESVVDAELAPLRRARSSGETSRASDVGPVAVELRQHELADVVDERGDRELVALRQPRDLADALGADPHRDRVAAEALAALRGGARGPEHVVGLDRLGQRAHALDLSDSTASRTPPGAAGRPGAVVGGAHDRDRQRRVGLDRVGELARGDRLAVAEPEQTTPGLEERGQAADRVERVGQPPAADAAAAFRWGRLRRLGHGLTVGSLPCLVHESNPLDRQQHARWFSPDSAQAGDRGRDPLAGRARGREPRATRRSRARPWFR